MNLARSSERLSCPAFRMSQVADARTTDDSAALYHEEIRHRSEGNDTSACSENLGLPNSVPSCRLMPYPQKSALGRSRNFAKSAFCALLPFVPCAASVRMGLKQTFAVLAKPITVSNVCNADKITVHDGALLG